MGGGGGGEGEDRGRGGGEDKFSVDFVDVFSVFSVCL